MTLARRKLRVTITLAAINGQAPLPFPNSGGADTVTLEGYRMSAEILHAGGPSDGTLDLVIYGASRSTMNRLATLGVKFNTVPSNLIVLEAGDDKSGMSTVFTGYILSATADFNASPDVGFFMSAHTLAPQAVDPAEASSFRGSADVATMMAGFARLMGLKFENNGITTKLSNAYFSGSVKTQAQECAEAAGIFWNHGEGGTLAIWPKGGARGGAIPLISPQTGMIGYPTYSNMGVDVRTLYNPSIGFGGKVQVQSSLGPACGIFPVYGLQHRLACEMPDGPWFSTVNCYNPIVPLATGVTKRPAVGPT
jgi:hypothetical protein